MRELDVPTSAWSINLAAAAVGLLVFAVMRYSAQPVSRHAWYFLTIGSLTAILLTFASNGLDGVHRWIFLGSFGLHASAVVAPVIIACVATAPSRLLMIFTAVATAILLALQPDAAQTSSFALACGVILFHHLKSEPGKLAGGLAVLIACAIASLVRFDPLKPVRHVEGIFEAVSGKGAAWAVLATVALLLLPIPFFLAWRQRRQTLTLALGVYVAMVLIAPFWGTFPVPVMGYGVSPILGYAIALGFSVWRKRPALIILLAFALTAGSPLSAAETSRTFGSSGPKLEYVVLGDSTAAGIGGSYESGIAVMTARELATRNTVVMTNFGVSGARMHDVRERQVAAAARLRPDVVLLSAGANDVTHLTRVRSMRDDLRAIVQALTAANPDVKIVITGSPDMGSPPRIPWILRGIATRRTKQVNRMFREEAVRHQLEFAPIADVTGPLFRRDRSLFANDRFHPNDRGYAAWIPVLNEALAKALR